MGGWFRRRWQRVAIVVGVAPFALILAPVTYLVAVVWVAERTPGLSQRLGLRRFEVVVATTSAAYLSALTVVAALGTPISWTGRGDPTLAAAIIAATGVLFACTMNVWIVRGLTYSVGSRRLRFVLGLPSAVVGYLASFVTMVGLLAAFGLPVPNL